MHFLCQFSTCMKFLCPLMNFSDTKNYFLFSASQSTPIQWKEGMDLAAKFAQKAAAQTELAKQRKRPLPQLRTFFTWFCDNGDPSDDEIAEVIKDDMW